MGSPVAAARGTAATEGPGPSQVGTAGPAVGWADSVGLAAPTGRDEPAAAAARVRARAAA